MSRQIRILEEPGILRGPAARYSALIPAMVFFFSIVGIPLAPFAYLVARWHQNRAYARLHVILTRRDLVVRSGVWNRQEKSIPLEKITDVALLEGPLMRIYGVKGLRVETAGQVSAGFGLVNLVGIEHPEAFRDAILDQRDRISDGDAGRPGSHAHAPAPGAPAAPLGSPTVQADPAATGLGSAGAAADPEVLALLREIRDELRNLNERDRS